MQNPTNLAANKPFGHKTCMEFSGRGTVEVDTEWHWFFYFNSTPPIYLLCVDLNVNKTRSDLMFSAKRSPEGFLKSTLRECAHRKETQTRNDTQGQASTPIKQASGKPLDQSHQTEGIHHKRKPTWLHVKIPYIKPARLQASSTVHTRTHTTEKGDILTRSVQGTYLKTCSSCLFEAAE